MKAAIAIFFKGIIMLLVGVYLASLGLPSDETDVTISVGNTVIDALNQTSSSPQVSEIAQNTKSSFVMLGVFSGIIGVLEIVVAVIAAAKSLS